MEHQKTIAQLHGTIQEKPNDAEAYKSLGNALQARGKLDEAKRAYSIAVKLDPDFVAAHANIGNLYYQQGKLEQAAEYYERAIAIGTQSGQNQSEFLPQPTAENLVESIANKQSIASPQMLAGIYANFGTVQHDRGLCEEAVACWEEALTLDRSFGVRLYWKVGNLLLKLGRYDEAIAYYEQQRLLCDRQPQSDEMASQLAKVYSNLGTARLYNGQVNEAIAAFHQALEIQPKLIELQCNLGLATGRLAAQSERSSVAIEHFNQAVNYFVRSLEGNPSMVEAHRGLFALIQTFQPGNWDLSSVRQAAGRYDALCPVEPVNILASTAVAIAHLKSGNANQANQALQNIEPQLSPENLSDWLDNAIDLLYSSLLFCFNRLRDDLGKNSKLSRAIGYQFSEYLSDKYARDRETKTSRTAFPAESGTGDRPLNIGFISSHFWRHSVGWCSADIISELSQLTPNLFLYATEPFQEDDKTEQFQKHCAKFYQPSRSQSDQDAIKLIQEIQNDRLDILIDLDSLTIPVHAEILHCQPAPICISWLGFDAPFISDGNYFLTDWHSHPSGVEPYYREQLLRMPDSFVAVHGFASEPCDRTLKRQGMRIDLNQVVYLCVAPATKLNPELASAQIKILKQVPNSILLYKGVGDPKIIQATYQETCDREGVSIHRVKFMLRNPTEEEHRTIYQIADVLLDSYPYNGGTHTLEALWFQLPIVTRFGSQFLARMGYSFLNTLGVSEGLASTWEDYITWGIKFGRDVPLRNYVKHQLKLAQTPDHLSPLWNPPKFAQDLYAILKTLRNPQ